MADRPGRDVDNGKRSQRKRSWRRSSCSRTQANPAVISASAGTGTNHESFRVPVPGFHRISRLFPITAHHPRRASYRHDHTESCTTIASKHTLNTRMVINFGMDTWCKGQTQVQFEK